MNLETLRTYCLSFPYVAENVQWDEHLVFRIALAGPKIKGKRSTAPQGKIFCIANLRPEGACVSFKCTPETFAELVELPDIAPAAYLARSHWVSLEQWDALNNEDMREHVRHSYDIVWLKLPKSTRERLANPAKKNATKSASRTKTKKPKRRS